jgi:hypothetical protein
MDLVLQIQMNDYIDKFHLGPENMVMFMLICYNFVVYSAPISVFSLFKIDGLHIKEIRSIC